MPEKLGDSSLQREAEKEMLLLYAQEKGLRDFGSEKLLFAGCSVEIDGYSKKAGVACEVFAHIGVLKPGQFRKIALDALKLIYFEKKHKRKLRKVLIFADNAARKCLKVDDDMSAKKWLADCLETFGIETWVAPLKESTKKKIKRQQFLQRR